MTPFCSGSDRFPSCRHFEIFTALHRTNVQAQFCCYFVRTVTCLSVKMQSKCFVAVSRMLLTCTVIIADWLTPAAKIVFTTFTFLNVDKVSLLNTANKQWWIFALKYLLQLKMLSLSVVPADRRHRLFNFRIYNDVISDVTRNTN